MAATIARPNEFAKSLVRNPAPVLFETVPPLRHSEPEKIAAEAKKTLEGLRSVRKKPLAVVIPDIVDSIHGKPKRTRMDPEVYAALITNPLETEAILDKVVVYFKTPQEFRDWRVGTQKSGFRNYVWVGPSERYHKHTGPGVIEALHLAKADVEANDGVIGAIALQTRRTEANRLFYKTAIGARFFTSQIAFESEPLIREIQSYYRLCVEFNIAPVPIFISFTALRNRAEDEDLLTPLSVELPERLQSYIYDGPKDETVDRITRNSLRVYAEVRNALESTGTLVPIGVLVERLRISDLDPAVKIYNAFLEATALPLPELLREVAHPQ